VVPTLKIQFCVLPFGERLQWVYQHWLAIFLALGYKQAILLGLTVLQKLPSQNSVSVFHSCQTESYIQITSHKDSRQKGKFYIAYIQFSGNAVSKFYIY
jgi:hypothetical protein